MKKKNNVCDVKKGMNDFEEKEYSYKENFYYVILAKKKTKKKNPARNLIKTITEFNKARKTLIL